MWSERQIAIQVALELLHPRDAVMGSPGYCINPTSVCIWIVPVSGCIGCGTDRCVIHTCTADSAFFHSDLEVVLQIGKGGMKLTEWGW
uniref:Uncharacterized protein n=1 Tax=Physcomitrium patens TaxID=3218 RepID=A0A2K1IYI4_PHYPA|nr:hypothetical protein PHYPA_024157 [Physcomitrium patens]